MEPTQPTPQTPPPATPPPAAPPTNPAPKPARSSKKIYILIAVVILIVILAIAAFLFMKPKPAQTQQPSLSQISSTGPTSTLTSALQNGDFSTIISYLAQKTPNSDWIDKVKNTQISYASSSVTLSPETATLSADLKPYATSKVGSSSAQILLDPLVKSSQPYAASALILQQLRSIYDLSSPVTDSTTCLGNLFDVYQTSAMYWQTLSSQQTSPIGNSDNTLLTRENDRFNVYKSGQLQPWVNNKFSKLCQVVTGQGVNGI